LGEKQSPVLIRMRPAIHCLTCQTLLGLSEAHVGSETALSGTLEDYLEAIFLIVSEQQVARVRDIAGHLQVHKSSVTAALRSLAERELIHYEPYGFVTLTDRGASLAQGVMRRHDALRDFFTDVLAVDVETAESAACQMEHAMPRLITDRLIRLRRYLTESPDMGETLGRWLANEKEHAETT